MKKKIFSIFLVMVLCIGMTAGCKKNVGTSQDYRAFAGLSMGGLTTARKRQKAIVLDLVVLPWKIHTILHLSRH